jgi:hypothetical protein
MSKLWNCGFHMSLYIAQLLHFNCETQSKVVVPLECGRLIIGVDKLALTVLLIALSRVECYLW